MSESTHGAVCMNGLEGGNIGDMGESGMAM